MDLLRMMVENRQKAGMVVATKPSVEDHITRMYVIEAKPSKKILKEYFEQVIEEEINAE
jgi:archaellum component FlaD/FlaE